MEAIVHEAADDEQEDIDQEQDGPRLLVMARTVSETWSVTLVIVMR